MITDKRIGNFIDLFSQLMNSDNLKSVLLNKKNIMPKETTKEEKRIFETIQLLSPLIRRDYGESCLHILRLGVMKKIELDLEGRPKQKLPEPDYEVVVSKQRKEFIMKERKECDDPQCEYCCTTCPYDSNVSERWKNILEKISY